MTRGPDALLPGPEDFYYDSDGLNEAGLPARFQSAGPEDNLNEEQRRAAEADPDRDCLVIAGAGTGKTKTIVARYVHLCRLGISTRRIMTVAFNRDAMLEMGERVTRATGISPSGNGTFHSHGRRILVDHYKRFDLPKKIDPLDEKECLQLLRAAVRRLKLHTLVPDIRLALGAIMKWKNYALDPAQAAAQVEAFWSGGDRQGDDKAKAADFALADLYRAYEEDKALKGRVDFADMILLPVLEMRRDPGFKASLAKRWDHILVDEMQDINDAQFELIEALASSGARIFGVGDDDQSIYGWRQARIDHIMNFQEIHSGATVVALTKNYRCSPEIIRLGNRVASGIGRRLIDKVLEATRESEGPPIAGEFDYRQEETKGIVEEIARLEAAGTPWGKMAVLARMNRSLRGVEDQLVKAKIPYIVKGGSFWQRGEVQDLLAYLRAVSNPQDAEAFSRIVNVPSRFIGKDSVAQMTAMAERRGWAVQDPRLLELFSGRKAQNLRAFLSQLARWRAALDAGQPLEGLVAQIVREVDYVRHLAKEPDSVVERMENILELEQALGEYSSLDDLLEHIEVSTGRAVSEKVENAVRLSSIHRAKGLEWDYVFVVTCQDGAMPHYLAVTSAEIDEERRLAYVAFTRARLGLYASYCLERGGYASPFLEEASDLVDFRQGFTPNQSTTSSRKAPRRPTGELPEWAKILEVTLDDPLQRCEFAFKKLAMQHHPDHSGSHEMMTALNNALSLARAWHATRRPQSRAA